MSAAPGSLTKTNPFQPIELLPLVHELTPAPDPVGVFRRLAQQPHCVFFDSALEYGELGRYSFVACDPFDWIAAPADGSDALGQLSAAMAPYQSETVEGLPPFQGGAAGLLGYELGRSLERLPKPRYDEFQSPAFAVGLYDVVIAYDHHLQRCWIISQGFPETTPRKRAQRANDRLAQIAALVESPLRESQPFERGDVLPVDRLAPQHTIPNRPELSSDFSRADYLKAVTRAVEYIHAGDVFQVNLSQRLLTPLDESPVEIYLRLRRRNAAPFAGYLDLGSSRICSASPERFVSVRGRQVETRPIKGTRRRTDDAARDREQAEQLLAHPKDRSENVMIVDLLRNDLSRVCEPRSVRVPKLCGLESYRHVHHLVSVVEGQLSNEAEPIDLLRAAFPGGSITGAPKVRAMEIIAELEPTARGPYCGSLAYLGFNGTMDSSILIRTLVAARGWLQASVGGGIVADSDPESEYEETWHKAAGLF